LARKYFHSQEEGPGWLYLSGLNYCFSGIRPFFCEYNEAKASKHINFHLLNGKNSWQFIILP